MKTPLTVMLSLILMGALSSCGSSDEEKLNNNFQQTQFTQSSTNSLCGTIYYDPTQIHNGTELVLSDGNNRVVRIYSEDSRNYQALINEMSYGNNNLGGQNFPSTTNNNFAYRGNYQYNSYAGNNQSNTRQGCVYSEYTQSSNQFIGATQFNFHSYRLQ